MLGGGLHARAGPQVDRGAQGLVAAPATTHPPPLAALFGDGRDAAEGKEIAGWAEASPVVVQVG